MGFTNEYTSDEDREKYNLDKIDKKFVVGGVAPRDWTVDKEINSFLRLVARGREEDADLSTWVFFYKGILYVLEINTVMHPITNPKDRSEDKIIQFKTSISEHLFDEVSSVLREAVLTYKDNGLFSTSEIYRLNLKIER